MIQNNKKTVILLAAKSLFQEVGLEAVTMEDISKAAGMGKSTLYYYFKSKEEIFTAVLEMGINETLLAIIKQMSLKTGFLKKFKTFAKVKFEMFRKRKSMYSAIEANMDAETFSTYKELKLTVHHKCIQKEMLILQQLFVEAAHNKEIMELNNSELEKFSYIFLLSIRGINREFINREDTDEANDTLSSFCELFSKGLK